MDNKRKNQDFQKINQGINSSSSYQRLPPKIRKKNGIGFTNKWNPLDMNVTKYKEIILTNKRFVCVCVK